ncbi:hypothetical protein OAF42_00375 [Planctomicrobium sp.]|jgi:hypothetical protein|nr:hypothetical protein [Planctomicrobium sp.]MDB4732873.1 hypothetical protein [Planctomicrobium sp.]
MQKSEKQTSLDHVLAFPMFVVTLVWLALAGVAMHLLSDPEGRYLHVVKFCGWGVLALWLVYFVEAWLHSKAGSGHLRQHLKIFLFPPFRLGGRDHVSGKTVWIPGMGWREASDDLANEIDIKLSIAMIAIALLVLPLLAVEIIYKEGILHNRTFGLVIQLAQAFIWFAFASEFLLMISLVKKKFLFMKVHWLDLAIICLPMIAFLRIFRLGSAARLTNLSKTAKVFRVRGLAMRAWRAILILQIVDRLIHRNPEKRLRLLETQIVEKRAELDVLEAEAKLLKVKIEEAEGSTA